jgi:hypothetical protein
MKGMKLFTTLSRVSYGWTQAGRKLANTGPGADLIDGRSLESADTLVCTRIRSAADVSQRLHLSGYPFHFIVKQTVNRVSWDAKPWSQLNGPRPDLHERVSDGE